MTRIVALTGGIASGKTAVSDRFRSLGVPVIDTDVIAREVVARGTPLLERLVEQFGAAVLDANGELDRRRLRDIVFTDPVRRKQLEALLHPAIRREALRRAQASTAPYLVLVIPLLAESGEFPGIGRVLVVDVAREVQIERVMARDGVRSEQAEAILAAQADRATRLALADDVIDNSGDLDALDAEVRRLDRAYRRWASSSSDHDTA